MVAKYSLVLVVFCFGCNSVFAASRFEKGFWIAHPTGAKVREDVTFEKAFKVNKPIEKASVTITAHHKYVLYVNGQEVGKDDCWEDFEKYDLKPNLRTGENTVLVKVLTFNSPASFFLVGKMEFVDGTSAELISDGKWSCRKESDKTPRKVKVLGRLGINPWSFRFGGGPGQKGVDRLRRAFSRSFEEIVERQIQLKEMRIIPSPKRIEFANANVSLFAQGKPKAKIVVSKEDTNSLFVASLLNHACRVAVGVELPLANDMASEAEANGNLVLIGTPNGNPAVKKVCAAKNMNLENLGQEGYLVQPWEKGILLAANTDRGLLYACYSFIQTWRKEKEALSAQAVRIEDWPTKEGMWRATNYRVDKGFASFYKFNYTNYNIGFFSPLDKSLGDMREFLDQRGITLALSFHPGGRDNRGLKAHFCFSDEEQINDLLSRVKEGMALGFKVIEIYQDDFPNSLLGCKECEAKYGGGLEGLTKAQMELMNRVCHTVQGRAEMVFCPRAYFCVVDPKRLPEDTPPNKRKTAEKWWKSREIIRRSRLPKELIMVTTHPGIDYMEELNEVYHGKRLLIFHNTLLPFDGRYWFEPYPVVSKKHLEYVKCWGIWCLGDLELWRAHLLTVIESLWNAGSVLPLESAFARLYGEDVAPALTRYSVLTCGSLSPRGVLGDCPFQREEYPQMFLDTGWFGRSQGKNFTNSAPTEENIEKFSRIAHDAEKAVELIESIRGKLAPSTAEKLKLNAERLKLDFEIQTAILKFKAGKIDKAGLGELLPAAKRLKEVIPRLQALGARGEGKPGDYRFEQILLSMGAVPEQSNK